MPAVSTPVQIRLIGEPADVERVAEVLRAALDLYAESRPYASRRNPSHVRLYLEVLPS